MISLHQLDLRLHADPSRVVVRPFHLAWSTADGAQSRAARLVAEVMRLSEAETRAQLDLVLVDFEQRHWQTRRVFMTRFAEISKLLALDETGMSEERRQLVGAYFCHEYSYAAAALMNPSVTPHFDQSGMPPGCTRIVMSLRAVGEGHISTVAFREGIISESGSLELAPLPPFATAADTDLDEDVTLDGPVEVFRHRDSTLSGTVIFPITKAQSNGLEDLRITRFTHDDGGVEWIGTYTAYNGSTIRSELMRTDDFRRFCLQPMKGSASVNKGMALFPRKVGGRYMMIGRQDGQNLFLLKSDDIGTWEGGDRILEPVYPWEFVQIGNCGPPIELDEGWLLLTHGVGAMRKYSIGAVLLDKQDPSTILARSKDPVLSAMDHDREGYVPNVVYTCGAMRAGAKIFIPYGLADSSVAFAFVDIPEMLRAME